jgi:hypothetical protein
MSSARKIGLSGLPPIVPPASNHYTSTERSTVVDPLKIRDQLAARKLNDDGLMWKLDDDNDQRDSDTALNSGPSGCTRAKTWISDHKLIMSGIVLLLLAGIGATVFATSPQALDWLKHTFEPWSIKELHNVKEAAQVCALGAAGVVIPYLFMQAISMKDKEVVKESSPEGTPISSNERYDRRPLEEHGGFSTSKTTPQAQKSEEAPEIEIPVKKPGMSKAKIACLALLILAALGAGYGAYTQMTQIIEHYDVMIAGAATSVALIGMIHYMMWAGRSAKNEDMEMTPSHNYRRGYDPSWEF